MRFEGKRLRIDPIEVWGYNNARKMVALRVWTHNSSAREWQAQGTTPDREWWRGFFSGVWFTIIVSSLIVYLFS